MRTHTTIRIVLLLALAWLGLCVVPRPTDGQSQHHQSSLRVRSATYNTNFGHVLLKLQVSNCGDQGVNVFSITMGKDGAAYAGGPIESGGVRYWQVIVDRAPAFITLDTSEGKFRFDL